METDYLREFTVFAESLNYTKAASELFISQPALRSHIRALEGSVGAVLVVHRNKRIMLTPAGRYLLQKGRTIIDETDELANECRNLTEASFSLVVGVTKFPVFESLLIKARNQFTREHPGSHVEIQFSPQMHANSDAVKNGDVDLALVFVVQPCAGYGARDTPPEGFECLYGGERDIHFWVTENNPLFYADKIHARDLEGMTLVLGSTDNMNHAGRRIREYFESQHVQIKVSNEPFASYEDYQFTDSANSFCITAEGSVFEQIPREGIRVFAVSEFTVLSDLYIVYDADRLSDGALGYLDVVEGLLAGLQEKKQE